MSIDRPDCKNGCVQGIRCSIDRLVIVRLISVNMMRCKRMRLQAQGLIRTDNHENEITSILDLLSAIYAIFVPKITAFVSEQRGNANIELQEKYQVQLLRRMRTQREPE